MVYNLAKQAHEERRRALQMHGQAKGQMKKDRAKISSMMEEAKTLRKEGEHIRKSGLLDPLELQRRHWRANNKMVRAHTIQRYLNRFRHTYYHSLAEAIGKMSTSYDRAHKLANGDAPESETYAGLMAQSLNDLAEMYHALAEAFDLLRECDEEAIKAYKMSRRSDRRVSLGSVADLRRKAQRLERSEAKKWRRSSHALEEKAEQCLEDDSGIHGTGVPPWETGLDPYLLKRRPRPRRSEQDDSESEQDSTWGQKPKFLC